MTGGILQLVAKGVEDTYLTTNPTITFFKTVYRRHTNFSKDESVLTFTNKLDFDKEGYCKIEHYGDLLHRLFLRIKLPKIDIHYKSFTIKEISDLLNGIYNIKWKSNKPSNEKFTEKDADEIFKLIDEKVKVLEENIETYTNIIYEMEYQKEGNNDIIYNLIKYEDYDLEYKIIDAHIKDTINNNKIKPLANALQIYNLVSHEIKKYVFSNNPNIEVLHNPNIKNNNCDAYKIFEYVGYDQNKLENGLFKNIQCLKKEIDKDIQMIPLNKYINNNELMNISDIRDQIGITTACYFMEMGKVNDLEKYFDEKKSELKRHIQQYEKNKKYLLNDIDLKKEYSRMYDNFENIINSFDLPDEVNKYFNGKNQYLYPKNNVADIIEIIKNIIIKFIKSKDNPFDEKEINKHNLWKKYHNKIYCKTEINKFNELFSWMLNSKNILEYQLQIETLFNNFSSEIDVYNFMKNYIVQSSKYLVNLPAYLNFPNKIIESYKSKLESDEILLNNLIGNSEIVGLKTIINRSLNIHGHAKFAWIKKIGHYIINNIWFKIDDQIIDKQYGEWMEIWHELTKRVKKEKGYNRLIGNIPELTRYNNRPKEEYELIIPLNFWFCRNVGLSLPLVALHNSDIRMYVNLKSFEELCYHEDHVIFRKKPKLNCSVMAEYIYVENEERNKISKSKLEYLIDVIQFNGELQINGDNNDIHTITRFKNPCKEFFWMLQDLNYIKKKKWHKYDYKNENPVGAAKITFNIRDREHYKDGIFYNQVQPYERHYSSPSKGINVYNFCLDPETVQPTGTANLSQIEEVGIHIKLNNNIDNRVTFRWPIYALTNNLLRIFSGLSGLVWAN
ncbi:NCLDV major capsid protein [Indivirus ILV1]|uniref:NCLDV major capsid protein n=1 Tax=Indivirus ILV1 TaxID=1977633 RepID=A0A1V0SCE2_9VIRU|nr:NCLDV major capsid protein [Indivirus ILV1]